MGSVCSGGRYDALASDGRTTYPGVGISLGVTRLLVPLFNRRAVGASRAVPSAVLVALVDEESRNVSNAIAGSLRARNIPCEVAASAQKFGKQIRYAERRGIPFVWFTTAEGGHEVKDIRSGSRWLPTPRPGPHPPTTCARAWSSRQARYNARQARPPNRPPNRPPRRTRSDPHP